MIKSEKLIEGFSFKIIDAGCESDLTMTERHSDHFTQDKVQFRKGFRVHGYYKSDKSCTVIQISILTSHFNPMSVTKLSRSLQIQLVNR